LDEKIVRVLRDQFKPLKNKYDSSGQFIDEEPSCSFRPDTIGIYYTIILIIINHNTLFIIHCTTTTTKSKAKKKIHPNIYKSAKNKLKLKTQLVENKLIHIT
jgi:hypothetical protein